MHQQPSTSDTTTPLLKKIDETLEMVEKKRKSERHLEIAFLITQHFQEEILQAVQADQNTTKELKEQLLSLRNKISEGNGPGDSNVTEPVD